ncbi:MAG: UDP-N-acetylglucosamine 1-carboxyvinyltransferase [Candidatus Daviesbacteria bacterium]|nr:UDP-N-acetylglucosamine 1-carboxyvinyltransferase [Candidatus Daviesbacteria bacterium]
MAKYIIEGGNKLSGKVKISGNKNSVLPCLAATLLTEEEVILKNIPNISDVEVFCDILKGLGASVERKSDQLTIQCKDIKVALLPEDKMTKIRASILLVGPLLARLGQVEFSHPGGDVIGKRSIDTHLEAFRELGYVFEISDRQYKGVKFEERTQNKEIFLAEASVTATENMILTTVLGNSAVILKNCATEPHVADLCNLLIKMGARIEGVGQSTLRIIGVEKLTGASFVIGSDFIEFGTYAIAAAITGGEVEIENIEFTNLLPVIKHLERFGLTFENLGKSIKVGFTELTAPGNKLHTNIWPGFPSDLMSVAVVLATQCKGISLLHDWMFESRMFFTDKLISMGANITIADPHRVLVSGVTPLYGRVQETPDIRAGMALVLASLVAVGKSTINKAELIERGYEDVVGKLSSLGAQIVEE